MNIICGGKYMEDNLSQLMELYEIVKQRAKEVGKDVFEFLKQIQSAIDDVGGFKGFVKWTSNMDEKQCECFSFADALAWVKPRLKESVHGGAIIYKMKIDPEKYAGKNLMIKISFMDKKEKVIEDTDSPYLIVECNSIDNELLNCFGDKDMIVLQ